MPLPIEDVLTRFCEKLGIDPPEDLSEGAELYFGSLCLSIAPGKFPGELHLEIPLAELETPLTEAHLEELCALNYLGANTAGGAFCLEDSTLLLSLTLPPSSFPDALWGAAENLAGAAVHYGEHFLSWQELSLLFSPQEVSS